MLVRYRLIFGGISMLQHNEPSAKEIQEKKLYLEMGLTDEEFEKVVAMIDRLPNYTETGIFSVMWSEHCSYKKSKPLLKKFPTEGKRVIQGPGEGAGIIDIGDNLSVVFKIESHNHPSAVEPFHGAATGVGGIIRDIFSMGARPAFVLHSLRFGELDDDKTKHLFKEVIRGMAHYSNGVGVPTVGGDMQFDDVYKGNPLVNAMCVGIMHHDDRQVGKAEGVGNTVMYLGQSTGRDGIHGATFASTELNDEEKDDSFTVKGNPELEKRLIDACLDICQLDSLIGIQDMGAAGLTSSASEMASKAGLGMELNLDLVPKKHPSITPYELMLSETQERMLIVVKKGRENEIKEVASKYDIDAVEIGTVIEEPRFKLLSKGEIVTDLPVSALTDDAPVYHLPSTEPKSFQENQQLTTNIPEINDANELLAQLLQTATIAHKSWALDQFQLIDADLLSPQGNGASIVRVLDSNKALALSTYANSRYIHLDPETGGKIAVAKAARELVATGAEPIALTDGLNFTSPDKEDVFWEMEKATDGLAEASRTLNVPVIGGNVSLYNESEAGSIYPTPIIGMVGLINDLKDVTTPLVKKAGHAVYLIGETTEEIGGSEIQKLLLQKYEGKAPSIDLEKESRRQSELLEAIQM